MFTTFAKYAFQRNGVLSEIGEIPPEQYWMQMSLWTQSVIDACFQSMKSNGAVTAIIV